MRPPSRVKYNPIVYDKTFKKVDKDMPLDTIGGIGLQSSSSGSDKGPNNAPNVSGSGGESGSSGESGSDGTKPPAGEINGQSDTPQIVLPQLTQPTAIINQGALSSLMHSS